MTNILLFKSIFIKLIKINFLDHPLVKPDPPSGFLEVKLGEEVKMSCKASGVPKPIVTWKHNVIIFFASKMVN